MKNISSIGIIFFSVAIAAFGIEFFIFGNLSALMPIAPAGATRWLWIVIVGILLLVSAAAIGSNKNRSLGATAVALVFLLALVYTHLVQLMVNVRNPGPWTAGAELLGLSGGALLIAGGRIYTRAGSLLFTICLIIVGVQHMLYAGFISQLIPSWIPARLFLAYFVGVAFFTAAISIAFQIKSGLAGLLLGIMFLSWVVILHAPRVMNNIHTETEWTSLFVALGMGGISLIIARSDA